MAPKKHVKVKAHKRRAPAARAVAMPKIPRKLAPPPQTVDPRAAAIAQMQQQVNMGPGGY